MNVAALLYAQAAAMRASADALEAAAKAAEHAPAEDVQIFTKKTWAGPCTFRTLIDASNRGELPKVKDDYVRAVTTEGR